MKKYIALLIVSTLIFSLLASCTRTKESDAEPTTTVQETTSKEENQQPETTQETAEKLSKEVSI
ncbi:MAG TPA: hypothetical protein GXX14_13215, partial [Clostridiaceae bacterium]|nr:hypothetical protein [Clostridiaceae bacterium]